MSLICCSLGLHREAAKSQFGQRWVLVGGRSFGNYCLRLFCSPSSVAPRVCFSHGGQLICCERLRQRMSRELGRSLSIPRFADSRSWWLLFAPLLAVYCLHCRCRDRK